MTDQMFCFQCEQTAGGKGCSGGAGVCGKKADVAVAQDDLTRALVALAMEMDGKIPSEGMREVVLQGLFTTITNVNFDLEAVEEVTARINAFRTDPHKLDCSAGQPLKLWYADEDIRSLKTLILLGMRGMAAYAWHAWVLGLKDDAITDACFDGLRLIGNYQASADELLPMVLKIGEVNLACMALLDQANTGAYGIPTPTTVPLKVEKGPFIVVTGHDLKDLEELLEQTEGKGVNIYTHGEMLPAHGYPKLRAYSHLKGNFGTAWQNQRKEFDSMPGPVLFATNCIMPPLDSYKDRVYTTGVVHFPGTRHIDEVDGHKDFGPMIQQAIALGGYSEDQDFTGINGGRQVMTGFNHNTVLSLADTVVSAVKDGAIKHFFLVGGCDGAKPGRNYYTDFVKATPADTVVLTLACGKFRFNDLDLGEIGGLPRLMDMGQCNDAYSAIKVAVALAEVFKCGVNDLPLSMVLSWYEQKAVCILLTLLYLGVKNIRLGPSLPAFVSPNILDFLVKNFNIAPISTPEEDLKAILG